MKQSTQSESWLEIKREPEVWMKAVAGMFEEARRLARVGRHLEAIDLAYKTQIENYGNTHGVTFRVVVKTETIIEE